MDERINKWLVDIQSSIQEIEIFLVDTTSFFDYQRNTLLKRAVERNLEIIGEAMNRIVSRDKEYFERITEARNIIGLRNQIIHAYDGISDENIWSILIQHVPILKKEVDQLINS